MKLREPYRFGKKYTDNRSPIVEHGVCFRIVDPEADTYLHYHPERDDAHVEYHVVDAVPSRYDFRPATAHETNCARIAFAVASLQDVWGDADIGNSDFEIEVPEIEA
jgi:hypothetical protein